jgi:O-antigen/teichoic acid export membrane protein
MVFSHTAIPGERHTIAWSADSAGAITRFGRWIFISTALTFIAAQGDRVFLWRVLDDAALGLFSIATMLAMAVDDLIQVFASRLLFPLFVQLKDRGEDEFRRLVLKVRGVLLILGLPLIWTLAIFGPQLVDLLYDDRHLKAGWMLQILACGACVSLLLRTTSPVLLARGDSFRYMVLLLARSTVLIVAMFTGYAWGDVFGLVVAIALTPALSYPAFIWAVRRHNVYSTTMDLAAMFLSIAIIGGGWLLTGGLPQPG